MDSARHVIKRILNPPSDTIDAIQFKTRGFEMRLMTWRALSVSHNAFDDVASTIHLSKCI